MRFSVNQRTLVNTVLLVAVLVLIYFCSDRFDPGILARELNGWTSAVEAMLLPLIGVGVLSAAFVEAFKAVARPRAWYHRWKVLGWLNNDQESYDQLIKLATGGDESTLMFLPTDQLMGQINAAIQIALQDPGREEFQPLIRQVTKVARSSDVDGLLKEPTDDQRMELVPKILPFVQRNLDGLQLHIQTRWALKLQALSLVTSAVIVFLSLEGYRLPEMIVISLIGGMLAPIARDLVMAIRKARAESQ